MLTKPTPAEPPPRMLPSVLDDPAGDTEGGDALRRSKRRRREELYVAKTTLIHVRPDGGKTNGHAIDLTQRKRPWPIASERPARGQMKRAFVTHIFAA